MKIVQLLLCGRTNRPHYGSRPSVRPSVRLSVRYGLLTSKQHVIESLAQRMPKTTQDKPALVMRRTRRAHKERERE